MGVRVEIEDVLAVQAVAVQKRPGAPNYLDPLEAVLLSAGRVTREVVEVVEVNVLESLLRSRPGLTRAGC
jgi:hypothetical protein